MGTDPFISITEHTRCTGMLYIGGFSQPLKSSTD